MQSQMNYRNINFTQQADTKQKCCRTSEEEPCRSKNDCGQRRGVKLVGGKRWAGGTVPEV
jgi:hypothetical protein